MKKFCKIHAPALMLDIGIFCYTALVHAEILGQSGNKATRVTQLAVLALVFLMQFVIPLVMRRLMVSYTPLSEKPAGKLLTGMMKFFYPVIIFFLFVMGFSALKRYGIPNSMEYVMLSLVGSLLALFIGGFSGEVYVPAPDKPLPAPVRVTRIALLVLPIFSCYVAVAASLLEVVPAPVALAGAAGMLALTVLAWKKLLPRIARRLENPSFRRRYRQGGELLLSLLFVTALTFLLELHFATMLRGPVRHSVAFMVLLITGYLPLRIFVELEPPLTPLSLFTGVLSCGYFVLRLGG
jgi:hypothetical protein